MRNFSKILLISILAISMTGCGSTNKNSSINNDKQNNSIEEQKINLDIDETDENFDGILTGNIRIPKTKEEVKDAKLYRNSPSHYIHLQFYSDTDIYREKESPLGPWDCGYKSIEELKSSEVTRIQNDEETVYRYYVYDKEYDGKSEIFNKLYHIYEYQYIIEENDGEEEKTCYYTAYAKNLYIDSEGYLDWNVYTVGPGTGKEATAAYNKSNLIESMRKGFKKPVVIKID